MKEKKPWNFDLTCPITGMRRFNLDKPTKFKSTKERERDNAKKRKAYQNEKSENSKARK